jgi:hypothetical protein
LDRVAFSKDIFSKLAGPPPYLPRLKFFEFRNLSVDVDEFEGLEEFTELRDVELFYTATLWDVK